MFLCAFDSSTKQIFCLSIQYKHDEVNKLNWHLPIRLFVENKTHVCGVSVRAQKHQMHFSQRWLSSSSFFCLICHNIRQSNANERKRKRKSKVRLFTSSLILSSCGHELRSVDKFRRRKFQCYNRRRQSAIYNNNRSKNIKESNKQRKKNNMWHTVVWCINQGFTYVHTECCRQIMLQKERERKICEYLKCRIRKPIPLDAINRHIKTFFRNIYEDGHDIFMLIS